ncbi:glycosyltransferase family 2 protein [Proteus terrae]|uniref:glycosyltransferase family 2 protein n=1 Tax=Proteus terrae TaxID=1574161 RepID=UPI000D695B14|nr:glycosyltransferase family 2 protein [Proteus terrae]
MMNNIYFSVVIPLYNKQESILRAIDSVLKQSYVYFELIIINDGSTDNSKKVIDDNVSDSRVKIFDQSNSGVSITRNNGIKKSKYNYVCLLDADDTWSPNFLNEIKKLVNQDPNCSLYSTRYKEIYPCGKEFIGKLSLAKNHFGIVHNFYAAYARSRSLIHSSSVCINKSIMEKVSYFPENIKLGEDIFTWLKLAENNDVSFSSTICSTVHRDAENRTNTHTSLDVLYHIKYYLSNDGLKIINKLDIKKRNQLLQFLYRNLFVNAIYSLSKKNKYVFKSYCEIIKKHNLCLFFILKGIEILLPIKIINSLANIRNKLQNE